MDTIFIYNPSSCRKKSFQILKFRLLLQFQIKILLALVQKKPLEIRTSWSSCMSGTSQSCNNVIIAVLYKIEYTLQKVHSNPFWTSTSCSWDKSTKHEIEQKRIKAIVIWKKLHQSQAMKSYRKKRKDLKNL